jgi:hypothetical protein
MYTLILSPHLDDALLSNCHFLTSYNCCVIIATIFTKEINHKFTGDYGCYANLKERKIEDNNAISNLKQMNKNIKIITLYLNLPDHLFRSYNSNITNLIYEEFNNLNSKYLIDTVYCPLGIGDHPDHLLTYEMCKKIFDNDKIFYYLDYPYCNLKLNVFKRFNYLNLRNNIKLTFNDLIEYYYHPIYRSCPNFIRLFKIINCTFYYLFQGIYNSQITIKKVDYFKKLKIISNYKTQIIPIFGSLQNLKSNLLEFNQEFYLKIN